MAERVIGIDIGSTEIRAAEVETKGRGDKHLLSYAAVPLPAGAVVDGEVIEVQTVASALKQLWQVGSFSHKSVVLGTGNSRTTVREMEVPSLPMDQLRSSLPFQVSEILPMSTDEALLDFYPTAERTADGVSYLRGIVVAVAKASVSNTVMAAESAGLKPVAIDLVGFALLRSLLAPGAQQPTVAIVDIGSRLTTVVIAEAGQPRLLRVLPSGGGDITEAVASSLQIPTAEAEQAKRAVGLNADVPPTHVAVRDVIMQSSRQLIEGIRNTFVYYQGNNLGAPIQHVLLSGGGSHLVGLGQYLASASRLPMSYGSSLVAVKASKKATAAVQGRESLSGVAIGLAMGEVDA